jgi:hypothetical protein
MTGPVGPVRSESDYFGLVYMVRLVRFVCKDNRIGPNPDLTIGPVLMPFPSRLFVHQNRDQC